MDPTENVRRVMVADINSKEAGREEMEAEHGQVWNTQELQQEYTVHGFMAPFVKVTRKADGKEGLMLFQHMPRFYYGFEAI